MANRSLKIVVTGDNPRSLKKITYFNWSGYAYLGTREQLKQLQTRKHDFNSSAIYFLLSEYATDVVDMYVGESDTFINRLQQHRSDSEKDWFNHFIVFLSPGNLNKGHALHLERIFYDLAKDSPSSISVKNKSIPPGTHISSDDIGDMTTFKENVLYTLQALNLSFFGISAEAGSTLGTRYILETKEGDEKVRAEMLIADDSYILLKGSHVKLKDRDSFKKHTYFKIWKNFIESEQVRKISDSLGVLKEDVSFRSPSEAAAIVAARSISGPTSWKNSVTGQTLKNDEEDLKLAA